MQVLEMESVPPFWGMGGRRGSEFVHRVVVGQPYLLLQTVFPYDVPFSHNTYVTDDRQQTDRQTTHCTISSTEYSQRKCNITSAQMLEFSQNLATN